MIIVRLSGGVGNQMFQYAAAKSLAIAKNTSLEIDINNFKHYTNNFRVYNLNYFNITSKINNNKIIRIYSNKYVYYLLRKTNKFLLNFILNIYFEPKHYFNQNFFDLSKNTYLIGYFQSELYFKSIFKTICSEFKFKVIFDSLLVDKVKSKPSSVSIHVRRGDYLNSKICSEFNVCNLDYFYKGINLISKKITNPYFFIFSDDVMWCKKNLKIPFPHYFVEGDNKDTSLRDLQLMSLCKHNIISNSTFSWWGAYLNQNENKIVIAPKIWFNHSDKSYYKDIVPDNWIKI
ncbi:MAG: alpha-1,2-fucosyltransferase [Candidatus ainarchaeum sp.]|nr:alpha-1,2-fucosyltransferase [Candidatus ainarchaeum sp.]